MNSKLAIKIVILTALIMSSMFYIACSTPNGIRPSEFDIKTSLPKWTKLITQFNADMLWKNKELAKFGEQLLKKEENILKNIGLDIKKDLSRITLVAEDLNTLLTKKSIKYNGNFKWLAYIEGNFDKDDINKSIKTELDKNKTKYSIERQNDRERIIVFSKGSTLHIICFNNKIIIGNKRSINDALGIIDKKVAPLNSKSRLMRQIDLLYMQKMCWFTGDIRSINASFKAADKNANVELYGVKVKTSIIKNINFVQLIVHDKPKLQAKVKIVMKTRSYARKLKRTLQEQLGMKAALLQMATGVKINIKTKKNVVSISMDVPIKLLKHIM